MLATGSTYNRPAYRPEYGGYHSERSEHDDHSTNQYCGVKEFAMSKYANLRQMPVKIERLLLGFRLGACNVHLSGQ